MSIGIEEELTIEDVADYAQEFGFQLLVYGDSYGLSESGRVLAIGTLDEIVQVIEVAEDFRDLTERFAPQGSTIH